MLWRHKTNVRNKLLLPTPFSDQLLALVRPGAWTLAKVTLIALKALGRPGLFIEVNFYGDFLGPLRRAGSL